MHGVINNTALIPKLALIPVLGTLRGRQLVLELSGLGAITPRIELEGPPLIVVADILRTLDAYGTLPSGQSASVTFLQTVREFAGDDTSASVVLDSALRAKSIAPASRAPDNSIAWKNDLTNEFIAEKIIGENTLRPIVFLAQGVVASKSVAYIATHNWTGSGFLLKDSILVTNNHVLPSPAIAAQSEFRFNFQLEDDNNLATHESFRAAKDGFFATNTELDFTAVELEGRPADRWGMLSLKLDAVEVNARVNIIQHPGGLPKQVSIQNNRVRYIDDTIVQYVTATLPGSSGAPVFDDEWRVLAVHHGGGMIHQPGSDQQFFRNEGIRMSAIRDFLARLGTVV